MKGVRALRRVSLLMGKKFSLFKYDLQHRMERGSTYSPDADVSQMSAGVRSMNLLDFSRKADKEIFMLDSYTDATVYGGLSEV
jgi:hypothetical protein